MSASPKGLDFRPRSLADAPDAWRDIDRLIARWVLAHGGSPTLARVAGWASFADGQGDSALMLDRDTFDGIASRDVIHALADAPGNGWIERVETDPALHEQTPFILDDDAFYLRRNFLQEVSIARRLRARLDAAEPACQPLDESDLDALFPGKPRPEQQPQRDAVQKAPGKRLFVLTGGPGTGKTRTVLRMLMALVRDTESRIGRAPVLRLAAPTGKAAQRLSESIRDGARELRASALPASWQPALQQAENAEAGTLHRLLGSRGGHRGFAHHREHRLDADIVVVDEASMMDLALLRALLDALRDDAVLVLVGDADQLASVGTGAVLTDLVSALDGHDALQRLHHSFRANHALAAINQGVRSGDPAMFEQAWQAGASHVTRHALPDARVLAFRLAQWSRRIAASLESANAFSIHDENDETAIASAMNALRHQQLLCALREGRFGAEAASHQIEQQLRRHPLLADDRDAAYRDGPWYPGRAVIVLRNDYANGLFNGDIGLCLRLRANDGSIRLKVIFDAPPPADHTAPAPRWRSFDPDTLPEHEPAFALTVHKSQGSEYAHVAVLLPPADDHPLLQRQMLYTALSRAREGIELWAEIPALQRCIQTPLLRAGKLAKRLGAA